MPAYATTIARPPRTLTDAEQASLLKMTGERRDGYRDHVIFAVALGLREHEIAALNVGWAPTLRKTATRSTGGLPCWHRPRSRSGEQVH